MCADVGVSIRLRSNRLTGTIPLTLRLSHVAVGPLWAVWPKLAAAAALTVWQRFLLLARQRVHVMHTMLALMPVQGRPAIQPASLRFLAPESGVGDSEGCTFSTQYHG